MYEALNLFNNFIVRVCGVLYCFVINLSYYRLI